MNKFFVLFVLQNCTPKAPKTVTKTEEIPNILNVTTDTTCGVCNIAIEKSAWVEHIAKEHNYLAWKVEDKPLVSLFLIILVTAGWDIVIMLVIH